MYLIDYFSPFIGQECIIFLSLVSSYSFTLVINSMWFKHLQSSIKTILLYEYSVQSRWLLILKRFFTTLISLVILIYLELYEMELGCLGFCQFHFEHPLDILIISILHKLLNSLIFVEVFLNIKYIFINQYKLTILYSHLNENLIKVAALSLFYWLGALFFISFLISLIVSFSYSSSVLIN